MRTSVFFILAFTLISCNTYKYANYYAGHVLKKNGLFFHSMNDEKYDLTYWDSETSKPALLLIHGFGTSGKFQWFKESGKLSKDYRLIIINLLYFGSKPKTPTYTVDGQMQAIEGLLKKLNIGACYVCGTSYGGLVAAELAIKNPDKIKKLILIDTPLKFLTTTDTRAVCEKYGISDQEELFVPSSPEMFKKLLSITYLKKPTMPKFMLRSFYKHTYEEEIDNLREIYKSVLVENDAFAATDFHFKMPVLLIWGEGDQLVPLHVAHELKAHIGANARLEIVPDAAHLPNLENEKMVNVLLLSFLKE